MVKLYTDGGFRPKYKLGAHAYIILSAGELIDSDSQCVSVQPGKKVTSITMEMTAAINAFEALLSRNDIGEDKYVYLITDNQYVQLGLTEWYDRWKRNNWRGSNNKQVQNLRLWRKLHKLYVKAQRKYSAVIIQWTQGHGSDEFNNIVDTMCNKSMDEFIINIQK